MEARRVSEGRALKRPSSLTRRAPMIRCPQWRYASDNKPRAEAESDAPDPSTRRTALLRQSAMRWLPRILLLTLLAAAAIFNFRTLRHRRLSREDATSADQ